MLIRRSFLHVSTAAIAASFAGLALWGEPPARSRKVPPPIAVGAGSGAGESTANIRSIPSAVAMTSVRPIARSVSRGTAAVGSPCDCDSDCSGLDAEFGCVQGQCIDGLCDVRDAPSRSICEDGENYCTIGRCDRGLWDVQGDGTCVDFATVDPGADLAALSRCAKECVGGANDGHNCAIQEECAGGDGCTLKTHAAPDDAGWQVTCTDTGSDYECSMTHGADDVVRCCETTDPADVGYISSAACSGFGGIALTITDPDDTMHVTSGVISSPRCPQYSSGIAPDDGGGFDANAIGPVTPPAMMCNELGNLAAGEHGAVCEIDADCHHRCAGGDNQGKICQPANEVIDCLGSTCEADTCVPNPDECPGIVTLGDDYSFDTDKWIRLQEIRFRGGTGRKDEVITFDIYDDSDPPVRVTSISQRYDEAGIATYRIIADCDEGCDYWQILCEIGSSRCELPEDPPRVIPPKGWLVMRASRSNPDTESGVVVYNEFDLNGWWVPTDGVDVGNNDPAVMWVDGPNVDHLGWNDGAGTPNHLAFELVGVTLDDPPTGGCCTPPDGVCVDTFEHLCRHCVGTGANVDNACDRSTSWGEGTWSGIDRDCPGISEGCSTNLWHGNRSTGDYLQNVAEDCSEACIDGSCCAADGTCTMTTTQETCEAGEGTFLGTGTGCSDDTGETPEPWEPNCCPHPGYFDGEALRDPGGECCEDLYACASGRRCDPLDSHSCDAPQEGPCALACAGAMVLELAVPPYEFPERRTVLNIQTDSTGVVDNPYDNCDYGYDPGWYVSWHLAEPAVVTLNLCCNSPVLFPAGRLSVTSECPCGYMRRYVAPNPNRYGYGSGCGNEFCCSDGNLSVEWTLGPGTYHWSPNSETDCEGSGEYCQTEDQCAPGAACIDHRGEYQIHLIAQPLPPGPCCLIDESDASDIEAMCATSHCELLSWGECAATGGTYLGQLPEYPYGVSTPVADCSLDEQGHDPCYSGACCILGGECDDSNGDKMACLECKTLGNTFAYHGGLTCNEVDCSICPFKDAEHGQADTGDFMFSADLQLGIRAADDFIPASAGVITRICYSHGYAAVGGECADFPPDDEIEVRFYDDNFGIPGTELIDSPGTEVQWDARGNIPGFRIWEYSAPIQPGVQVEADTCYWISIQGWGRSDCILNWIESRDGNNYRVVDTNGIWDLTDFRRSDYVWFLDIGIVPAITPRVDGGCGDIPVACCKNNGTCEDTVISECLAVNGIYFPISIDPAAPWHSCDDITCPVPIGDDCADAVPMCVKTCQNTTDCKLSTRVECETQADCDAVSNDDLCLPWAPCSDNGYCSGTGDTMEEGPVCSRSNDDCYDGAPCRPVANADVYRCELVADTRLATTDGPKPGGDCAGWIQADIWKKITALCTGTMVIDECNSLTVYDGMLEVFGNHTSTFADTGCPVDDDDNSNLLVCNDDFCPGSAVVEGLETPVIEGATYLIRWGGWSPDDTAAKADQGIVSVNVGMICPEVPPAVPPGLPSDALHRGPKNRHISMDLSTNGLLIVAYKVTLSEMYRCSGDTRRACLPAADPGDPDACPGICTGDADLQCSNDAQCGGAGPCIPSGPCAAHGDVGSVWYIDTPFEKAAVPNNDMVGEFMANLVVDPVYRVWPEDTVHVTACEVVPAAVYEVRSVEPINSDESDPLTIGTIGKPLGAHYGDVVGIVAAGEFTPPQGVVGVTDIQAYLIAFQGGAPGTAPPHTTWVDLHGTQWPEPCTGDTCTIPQAILNISDLGRIKFGFLGQTYVQTPGQEDPGNCP